MSNEDRLKDILAKQATIVAKGREQNKEVERTVQLRTNVTAAWVRRRAHIVEFIQQLNKSMAENKVELCIVETRPDELSDKRIDLLKIRFVEDRHEQNTFRRLDIDVLTSGDTCVRMGSSSKLPVKQYALSALEDDDTAFERAVLDFLETNL